ncbi:hypothetical protein CC86DRAFT_403920 [Ophiobolus disseminans]|uniref:Uncharacterized protein n=1 Tax=Ophiobolus disseminans TaxID=1469910 RepID=A0A6A7A8Y1_9PLEO|nr:hypothetical protein CC86DRAFT_403920 [Ophiobolus disseminans]
MSAEDSQLTAVGESGGALQTQTHGDATKKHESLDLSQLRTKFSENETLEAHLHNAFRDNELIFEDYNQPLPTVSSRIQQRLQITRRKDSENADKGPAIWANVHALPKSPTVRNIVCYYSEDGNHAEIQNIDSTDLLEPFHYITGLSQARARMKLRFIILMFFLERGYLDRIQFPLGTFDELRKAIGVISKARADAGNISARQISGPASNGQTSTGPGEPYTISTLETSTESAKTAPAEMSQKTSLVKSIPVIDKDFDHFNEFRQHIRRNADQEIDALNNRVLLLKSQLSNAIKERNRWESNAKFVREELRKSEGQRHETNGILD